jgi:hypothetical protein
MTTDEMMLERFQRRLAALKRFRAFAATKRSRWHQDMWLRADCLYLDLVKLNKQRRIRFERQYPAKEAA